MYAVKYTMPGGFLLLLASFVKNNYYAVYGASDMAGGANIYFLLMELLAIGCFLCLRKMTNNKMVHDFGMNLPLAILLTPLIMLNGSLIRMGQYFTLYLMVILPMTVNTQVHNKKMRDFTLSAMMGVLMYMALKSTTLYYFYWER